MTDADRSVAPIPIAYVTARFPPMTSTGTFRVEALMRHLPGIGFHPTVVTLPGGWVEQQSGGKIAASGVPEGQPDVHRPDAPGDALLRTAARLPLVRRAVRSWMVPDILSRWARHVPKALGAELDGVRLVLATSPPFSAIVAAAALATRLGVPCVQELRDPTTLNRRATARSNRYVERLHRFDEHYLPAADALIFVTPGTRAHYLESIPRLDPSRAHVVTNGYPDHQEPDPSLADRDPERFTMAYVGSFRRHPTGTGWLTPAFLLPVLASLPDPTELRIVGPVTRDQRAQLGRHGPGLVLLGAVSRERALAEMAAADVCLVLAGGEPWWIGRKVFEYLAFARQILAVVPPGDTAELLNGSSKSIVVPSGDSDALIGAVQRLHRGWRAGRVPSGPEPDVPTDRRMVERIGAVLHQTLQPTVPDD